MSKFTLASTIPLPNTSLSQPRLGFGVWDSPQDVCLKSCLTALKAGYRHIDTAQCYLNEVQVGQAADQCNIPRKELYLTTKTLYPKESAEATYASIVDSVKKTGGKSGYVDLFLIHTYNSGSDGRKMLWQALERAHQEGIVKAIGVSNFGVGHIEEMKDYAKVWPPHVNQIELHAWCQQREIDQYCQQHKIVVQAYCPIVRNMKAKDPTLMALADKYKKTPSQVLIRYCLQKNWVPLPKSDTPSRIAENADVYDFHIDDKDMQTLDSLDEGAKGAIVVAVKN